jgi:hypothetical protein
MAFFPPTLKATVRSIHLPFLILRPADLNFLAAILEHPQVFELMVAYYVQKYGFAA